MLRLATGESGRLITPLTVENLTYQGALNTGTSAPDPSLSVPNYNNWITPNVVHYIDNTDSLTLAVGKIGYAFLSRLGNTVGDPTGGTVYGAIVWSSGSSLTCNAGSTIAFNEDVNIAATKKLYLDGGGDSYIVESAGNVIDFYANSVNAIRYTGTAINLYLDTALTATKKFYLDGGSDTYIYESAGNTISFVQNADRVFQFPVKSAGTYTLALTTDIPDFTHVTYDNIAETITNAWSFTGTETGVTYSFNTSKPTKITSISPNTQISANDLAVGEAFKAHYTTSFTASNHTLSVTELGAGNAKTWMFSISVVHRKDAGEDGRYICWGWIGEDGGAGYDIQKTGEHADGNGVGTPNITISGTTLAVTHNASAASEGGIILEMMRLK